MNPQQQVFNAQLVNDPSFVELENGMKVLTDNQSVIKQLIEENEIETREEFAKGTRKFERLESEIGEVRNEMEELKREMQNGFNLLGKGLHELRTEIKDDKMEKMSKQLEKLQAEKEKKEENIDNVKRNLLVGTLIAIIGIVVTYFAYTLGLTPPTK